MSDKKKFILLNKNQKLNLDSTANVYFSSSPLHFRFYIERLMWWNVQCIMAILFVTYSMVNITLKFIFSCNSSYKVGFKGVGSRDADPPTELLYLFFPKFFKISFQIFLISKLRLGALIGRSCLSSCLSVSLLLKLRILLKLGNVSRIFFLHRKDF